MTTTFTLGPSPNTVRAADGNDLTVPTGLGRRDRLDNRDSYLPIRCRYNALGWAIAEVPSNLENYFGSFPSLFC